MFFSTVNVMSYKNVKFVLFLLRSKLTLIGGRKTPLLRNTASTIPQSLPAPVSTSAL